MVVTYHVVRIGKRAGFLIQWLAFCRFGVFLSRSMLFRFHQPSLVFVFAVAIQLTRSALTDVAPVDFVGCAESTRETLQLS